MFNFKSYSYKIYIIIILIYPLNRYYNFNIKGINNVGDLIVNKYLTNNNNLIIMRI